ncbi:MAG: hypothetical protein R2746_18105 [Acidimicrobiales bacterium]
MSQRSGSTSVTASVPATTSAQNSSAPTAPGRKASMPTMAMSSGSGCSRSRTRSGADGVAASAAEPPETSSWRAATVVTSWRSVATSPIMYMPSRRWWSSSTDTTPVSSRVRPLEAMRSRPRLSVSSSAQRALASTPSASSSALRAAKARTKSVSTHRVAWPGAVSSSTVVSHATATSWKAGWIAPASTASSVKR